MGDVKYLYDKWGYEVNTSSDACISAINAYYDQVLNFGKERSVILEASVHDAKCVLGNILVAHYLSLADPSLVPKYVEVAQSHLGKASSYEKTVFDSIKCYVSTDRDDYVAVELHAKALNEFPRDITTLKRAQLLTFYMGIPDRSLQLIQQVLPYNKEANYIYPILAFAFLEVGQKDPCKKAALKGFEIDHHDPWAHHAVCHVLHYQCEYKEAVEFMKKWSFSWDSCGSFMYTHNWWHISLCFMEGHAHLQEIFEIYDNHIWRVARSTDPEYIPVCVNASGLLMRLYIEGRIDATEERLQTLVAYLTDSKIWLVEWLLDLLNLWSFTAFGECAKAEILLEGLKSKVARMSERRQKVMKKALLLAEAMYAYGKGDYEAALASIGPDFDAHNFKMVGASNEQLDVFNEVWYNILLNAGQVLKAVEVLERDVKGREGVPYMWRMLERAYSMSGQTKEAIMAGEKAEGLERAYFRQ